jgi:MarR family transcriptional regulator, temperature-dependent positive regulator of motility
LIRFSGGISLGGANHAVQALLRRGWVEAQNVIRSDHRRGYLYLLTPDGLSQNVQLACRLLSRKRAEIESLQREIESGAGGGDPGDSPTLGTGSV